MFTNIDPLAIIIALVTGLAMLALISLSVLFVRYRKRNKVVMSLESASALATLKNKRQNSQIARLEEAKRDLELRFLPTTEEEKLFQPFREQLHEIVGECFLVSAEFSKVKKLGSGAFGEAS